MKISIIIPAWHEEKTIVRTLDALKQLNYSLKECELIIAASIDDNTYSIAKGKSMPEFGRYLVLKQEPGGKNTALQQGIKEAKGDVLVLLDADTIVERNWLKELTKIARQKDYATVDCLRFQIYKTFVTRYYAIREIKKRCIDKEHGCGGPSVLIKRKVIDEIGIDVLFNKNVNVAVDALLTLELKKRGYKLGFCENTSLDTQIPPTLKEFVRDEIRWQNGVAQIMKKSEFFKILATYLTVFLSFLFTILSIFYFNSLFLVFYLILVSFILKQAYTFAVVFNYTKNPYWKDFFPYLLLDLISISIVSVVYMKILLFGGKKITHFKGYRPKGGNNENF